MKTKIFILLASIVCMVSCRDGIWNAIHDLEDKYTDLDSRLAKLEEHCKEMNTNISSLKTLVNVILNNDYIISTTPITKDGKEIGYVITFAIHEPITIYHGQNGKDGADGKDGKNGENGTNGQDGKDGADGITPIIGVAQDETDHAYYWTLNGEWLLDANGNRIPLSSRDGINGQDGQDGKDGKDGINGQDGITPRLKIENGYWFISYDEGVTWIQLGKAVGENGQDGNDGQDGEKGDKGDQGEPGYSMFTEVTQDDNFVYFTLYNGTILTVRKGNSTFDQTIIDNLVTSLTLDKEEIWFTALDQVQTIVGTTTPFPNSTIIWSSADPSVVTVDGGVVTSHGTGSTTLTARAGDKSAIVKIFVGIGDPKAFSVSTSQKVYFSPADLVYIPEGTHLCADGNTKKGIWRFFDDQLSHLNHPYLKFSYLSDSKYYNIYYNDTTKSCDKFLLGSSGYKYSTIPANATIQCAVSDNIYRQDITGTYYDWGLYNAIENGGNIPGVYRTPSFEEWHYLLEERDNAENLKKIITIAGTNYQVLFPDYWQYIAQEVPSTITNSEWKKLEYFGAVALLYDQIYWSTSYSGQNSSTHVYLYYGVSNGTAGEWISIYDRDLTSNTSNSSQCRVRLVKDVE